MDIYHVWGDLKPGVSDIKFAENVARYMGHLKEQGLIEAWRLTRRNAVHAIRFDGGGGIPGGMDHGRHHGGPRRGAGV